METKFINKVKAAIAADWIGNYEVKEINNILIVYQDGKEIAFIKDYRADCEDGGSDTAVEQLQYYCDTF